MIMLNEMHLVFFCHIIRPYEQPLGGSGDDLGGKMNKGALDGITVLDMSRLLPGPYASMILADHGARVIVIEDRRFAAESLIDGGVNRNKEHMTLNLKSEAGRDVFFKLAASADVVLEGFRPGVTKRLGVDYDAVSKVNPAIVYCSISGYGQTGSYRDVAGHDVNYLSVSGVLDLIGEAGGPPVIPGIQIADMAGGGMNAVMGILMALVARQNTGKGQYIDISMTDGCFSLLTLAFIMQQMTGQAPKRADFLFSHRYACYNIYETKDGRYLSIGAVENRFWKILCEFFGVPEYIEHQYNDARRQEIIDYFRGRFKTETFAYWEEALADKDVCWAPVRTMSEAVDSPLFKSREMIAEIETPGKKPIKVLGTPIKLSRTPGGVRTAPPGFGQDTHRILKETGYSDSDIERLEKAGAV